MSNDKEYMRKYMAKRYKDIMSSIHDHLGGICVECGVDSQLHIDHIDPTTKKFTIGRTASSKNKKELWEEVDKCQLLCVECHKNKHEAAHGKRSMYNKGCRCVDCIAATRLHSREYKREIRRKARMGLE